MSNDTWTLILLLAAVFGALAAIAAFSSRGSLDSIKSKTGVTASTAPPAGHAGGNQEDPSARPSRPRCAEGERSSRRTGGRCWAVPKEGQLTPRAGFGRYPLPRDRGLRRWQDRSVNSMNNACASGMSFFLPVTIKEIQSLTMGLSPGLAVATRQWWIFGTPPAPTATTYSP